ncbi:hypothetical protein Tco_0347914 [Tanacetum coccineum]
MADALAEYEVNRNSGNRNGNGNDNGSHDSWGGGGRTPHTARECCVLLLRFAYAFWFCDLVLRFASAFCLIEDLLAFCLGETLPISIFGCVLSKAWTAFCFKTSCVLSQDFLAFCLKTSCVNCEGQFHDGTTRVIVAEGTEGSLNLGPERPRVYSDLSQDEKGMYKADNSELTKHHTSRVT